jgi:hypothetical protein
MAIVPGGVFLRLVPAYFQRCPDFTGRRWLRICRWAHLAATS